MYNSLSPPPSLPPHPLPTLPLSLPTLSPPPSLPSLQQIHCPFQPKQSPSLFSSNSTSDADSNPRPDPPLCILARTNHLSFDMKKNWICLKITKQAVTFWFCYILSSIFLYYYKQTVLHLTSPSLLPTFTENICHFLVLQLFTSCFWITNTFELFLTKHNVPHKLTL